MRSYNRSSWHEPNPCEKLSLYVLKKITYPLTEKGFQPNIDGLNEYVDQLCIFDSNPDANKNQYIHTDKIIAIGKADELLIHSGNAIEQLQFFCNKYKDNWLFGYLSYDLKNEVEQLSSGNKDIMKFPILHFFVPEIVLQFEKETINIYYNSGSVSEEKAISIYQLATGGGTKKSIKSDKQPDTIHSRITKEEYIKAVNGLKQHIRKGDIYEVNFCQEFYNENTVIDPLSVYKKLNALSMAPFSAYFKLSDHYLICSSPERFLQKRSNRLISQPIKGTAKRSADKGEDEQLKKHLRNSEKEKSENVMIVDLVRNDLSKVAKRGSVNVDELFGIYSFKQVHQMISTISCELNDNISFTDIIKATFPMGSMTGAPKVSAMQLIEQYESTKRGLYSGAVGYIAPNGDFDFNVVIRSIIYNKNNQCLSFMVGSAITDKSEAKNEYEECLLKAKAMFEVLK